jgi:hypothetical protein
MSACFHARTTLAKRTRSNRSVFVHAGRFTCRLRMMSCCRKRAFSAYALRFASGKICECPKGQGGSERCGPMDTARTEYAHRRTNRPLETRKNHNELLLQEDPLIFMLSCEHMFTSANFTPVHIHLQPMKAHTLLLTAAFSEQMCQVASTAPSSQHSARNHTNAHFTSCARSHAACFANMAGLLKQT